jgi:peptidoglycan/LPS O-acetylase OafA/YrhL
MAQESSHENRVLHHIPELDGLRGIAIIFVVFFHARPAQVACFNPLPFLHTLLGIGPTGVDLFFVLSGFLITNILLSTKNNPPRAYFWSFYARRILRIFPLYLLAVAAFFYLELPYQHHHGALLDVSRSEQVWYWTYLNNWHDAAGHMIDGIGHFWSLAVEEQFYLIWPAVVFFCAVRYFPALCIGLGAFSAIVRVIVSTGHYMAPELIHEFIHRATVTRLDTLAVGALIAALVRNPEWTKSVRDQIKLIAPISVGMFILAWAAWEQGIPYPGDTFGYIASAIAFGCLVFVCVVDQGTNHPACRVARLRFLQSIGRYSYAMYVIHITIQHHFEALLTSTVLPRLSQVHGIERVPSIVISFSILAFNLGASYGLALASWHLFEKHFLRLKKYFPYQVDSRVSSEPIALAKAAGAD